MGASTPLVALMGAGVGWGETDTRLQKPDDLKYPHEQADHEDHNEGSCCPQEDNCPTGGRIVRGTKLVQVSSPPAEHLSAPENAKNDEGHVEEDSQVQEHPITVSIPPCESHLSAEYSAPAQARGYGMRREGGGA